MSIVVSSGETLTTPYPTCRRIFLSGFSWSSPSLPSTMAPTPSPSPSPSPSPGLLHALGSAWNGLHNVLQWFVRIVQTSYGYSDMLVKARQDRANRKYVEKKAEERAYQIMEAQRQRRLLAMRLREQEESGNKKRVIQKRSRRLEIHGNDIFREDWIDAMLDDEIS